MSRNPDAPKKHLTDKAVGGGRNSEKKLINGNDNSTSFQVRMLRPDDRSILKNSLLISLLFFIALTFIVFPEVVSRATEARQDYYFPTEVDWPTTDKELPPEPDRVVRTRPIDFEPIPMIDPPGEDMVIVAVPTNDYLSVKPEPVSSLIYGIPSSPPGPVEVAGNVIAPVVTFPTVQPFPQKAAILRRNGRVRVRLLIRKNGDFEILRIMEENPPDFGFGQAAMQYLLQSKWKPAMQNGRPIDVYYEITILFNLVS